MRKRTDVESILMVGTVPAGFPLPLLGKEFASGVEKKSPPPLWGRVRSPAAVVKLLGVF